MVHPGSLALFPAGIAVRPPYPPQGYGGVSLPPNLLSITLFTVGHCSQPPSFMHIYQLYDGEEASLGPGRGIPPTVKRVVFPGSEGERRKDQQ